MSTKLAEAMKTTETDSMKKLEELHERPEGRPAAGSLSAPWGEAPSEHDDQNGLAAWEEFLQDGPKLLAKAFDGFEASAKGDKSFINEYFDTRDYTSHSPLLRKYAEAGHVPSDATLAERVQALTGRR